LSPTCYTIDGGVTIQAGFIEVVYATGLNSVEVFSNQLLSASLTPVVGGTIVPCTRELVTDLTPIQATGGVQFLAGGAVSPVVNPTFQARSISLTTVMNDPLILSGISVAITMGNGNVVTQYVAPNSSHTWNLNDNDDYIDSFTMSSLGAAMRVYWNVTI